MDFPKSVPSVGLVDGKFVDEDALAATPGSLIPAAWGNAVTLELLNVITSAGLEPSEADLTQLLKAVRTIGQAARGSYAADTGVANAYVVTYIPSVTALTDGLALRFKAKTANTGASTFSPNGLPAKTLVGPAHAVLQGGEIAANGMCTVVWSETLDQWILEESSAGGRQVAAGSRDKHAVNVEQLRAQSVTAFSVTGAGPALTLTVIPSIAAYANNQRFRVKFNVASSGADTLNISAKGAKSLKQYDATGTKVPAVFVANQLADVEYDGTDLVILNPLTPAVTVPAASEAVAGILRLASTAQVLAGTNTVNAVTAAGLVAGLLGAGGVAASDYLTIPFRDKTTGVRRDFIVQWGAVSSLGAEATTTVTFPLMFPNALRAGLATVSRATAITGGVNSAYFSPTSASQATIVNDGSSGATVDIFWFAIGY